MTGFRFSAPSLATVILSGVFGLYYLGFFFEYHGYPGSWWTAAKAVEHGLVWAVLSIQAVRFSVSRGRSGEPSR